MHVQRIMAKFKELQPEHQSTPNRNEEATNEIAIGHFRLGPGKTPGKLWLTSQSGQRAEIDEKVLEDVLKSFF